MEQTANEAVSQIALTGHTPKAELIEKLASNADMSIDMLSRMGDPNDARQSRACVRLIDDITAYSLTDKGRRYVNLVRNGLKRPSTAAIAQSRDSTISTNSRPWQNLPTPHT